MQTQYALPLLHTLLNLIQWVVVMAVILMVLALLTGTLVRNVREIMEIWRG